MGQKLDPFLLIKTNYTQMNPAMQQIADFLLSWQPDLVNFTIGEIAEKSGVSNASVTRFVQMLGYENFKAFHRSLQEYMLAHRGEAKERQNTSPLLYGGGVPSSKDSEEVCRYVIESEMEMLRDTLMLMDFKTIEQVAQQILGARSVLFIGEGRSFLAAQSACTRFMRLGVVCNAFGDFHGMISATSVLNEQDLLVGISNMGSSSAVVKCMRYARKNGVKTVGVTSVKSSLLAATSDAVILTGFNYRNFANRNEATFYEPGSENLPQFSVIECLYLLAGNLQKNDFLTRYLECAKFMDDVRC